MSNKKNKAETTNEPPVEQTPLVVSLEEFEALKAQLAEVQAKSDEYLDGWKRALADFDNYKKRVERDRMQDVQNIKGDIVKHFLPVVDDLERALQNRPADPAGEAWVGGVELILRKLQGILESEGVQRIQAEGQLFDPNFHEAISQEPAEGVESGIVIGVIRQGYLLGERVLRPACVRVAA